LIVDRVMHPGWFTNGWLIAGREDGRGLLFDTGADAQRMLALVRKHGVRIVAILCSHRHHDHVTGLDFLARNLGAPVLTHPLEQAFVAPATDSVTEGHTFTFTSWTAEVLHLPGHTAGQIGLHVPGQGLWTADSLFKNSLANTVNVGQGDYPGMRATIDRLLAFPPETPIYPGHGEPTTVGAEYERNPFVRLWRGLDPPGTRPGRFEGKRVTIEVYARDFDGNGKAQVRFPDGRLEIVPGSKLQKVTL
jgi:glyoxylase-like metal-dependent hydrolase (beta-lactamase superfamily II)